MLIISSRINNMIPEIEPIITSHDRDGILAVAKEQLAFGADSLDVCCCQNAERELDDVCWIIDTIQKEMEVCFCIDSPEAAVQRAALSIIKGPQPIVDSTTLEKERVEAIVPLVKEFNTKLIVLLHDESGMPGTTQEILHSDNPDNIPSALRDRMRMLPKVDEIVATYGLNKDEIYLDALVFPVATDTHHWVAFQDAVRRIRREYPAYHLSAGIDNGGFGLPNPDLLNIVMTDMHMGAGGDTVMVQLTEELGKHIRALRLLRDEDEYCMDYINAYNDGLL